MDLHPRYSLLQRKLPEEALIMSRILVAACSFSVLIAVLGCDHRDTTSLQNSGALQGDDIPVPNGGGGAAPQDDDPSLEGAQRDPGVFPADWCARLGVNSFETSEAIFTIAADYFVEQSQNCRTAGLTPALSTDQGADWLNYLYGFTNAMSGCPYLYEPIEGGMRVFGPANIAAIGLQRSLLGRDDVQVLIGMYLSHFAQPFQLSDVEFAAVEAYLWRIAEPEIDPDATEVLSTCGVAD
jgi:hypothetical protein